MDNSNSKDDDSKIFPQRLMEILSDKRSVGIIEWLPHGRAFVVKDRNLFAEKVMPLYFTRNAKYSSFTRKLNRWNFVRVSSGPEIGALYHEFFLRDKPHLTAQMFCKNARSKLAMSDDSMPTPTQQLQQHTGAVVTATNSSSNSNSSVAATNVKAAPRASGSPPITSHESPFLIPPMAATASTMLRNHVGPLEQQQQYTLPPDIPLSLLEMLSKGGPSSSDVTSSFGASSSSSSSTNQAPVPSRLLQQSQYANLLLERQIQILQQEQAKLLLMRQAVARRQHLQSQQQQQQQSSSSSLHPQLLPGLDLSSSSSMLMGPGGLAAASAAGGLPPSSSSSASALLAAAAASGSNPDATAAALELLQRDEEDRLCQLLHLKMGQQQQQQDSKKGTQPTNHRASAA